MFQNLLQLACHFPIAKARNVPCQEWIIFRTLENKVRIRTDQPAVSFELPDINGELHRLNDGLGHWQLLDFHRHLG